MGIFISLGVISNPHPELTIRLTFSIFSIYIFYDNITWDWTNNDTALQACSKDSFSSPGEGSADVRAGGTFTYGINQGWAIPLEALKGVTFIGLSTKAMVGW